MRRAFALALVVTLSGTPTAFAAAAAQAPVTGSIAGSASSSTGQTMANAVVQLRDLATGQLMGSTTANAAGQFSFVGLNPGNFVIEVLNAAGEIVGTSTSVTVAAGAAVTGVGVTASAAGAAALGGAVGGGGIAGFMGSTVGIVTTAAAGAAVAGVTVASGSETASGSQ